MKCVKKFIPVLFISTLLIISSCSDNNIVLPTQIEDYFPTNSSIIWKYSTNVLTDNENDFITFEMKIDSFKFNKGKFLALMGKREIDTTWGGILAISDSGNIIYGIGDNPPETPYPLFKHEYERDEAASEKINILGKEYDSKKVVLTFKNNSKLNMWFVNGIGLVKEESLSGVSLFIDEHFGDKFHTITELISIKQ